MQPDIVQPQLMYVVSKHSLAVVWTGSTVTIFNVFIGFVTKPLLMILYVSRIPATRAR